MMRKFYFFVMVMLVAVVIFATPVFAAELEDASGEVILSSSDAVCEVSEEQVDLLGLEEAALGGFESYLEQPKYAVAEGYDLIMFYAEGVGRAYLVIDKKASEKNWCLYSYREDMAKAYLTKTDLITTGAYLPVRVKDHRSDDSSTSYIDESKVPIMSKEAFGEMSCDWRNFSEIPFTRRADGSIKYLTYIDPYADDEEDEDDDEEEQKDEDYSTSTDPDDWHRYDLKLESGNTYTVLVTKSVSYNGKQHVLKGSRPGKNKTDDVEVQVRMNGILLTPNLYKVQFKNNKNCNGYGGDEKTIPYIRLKFKKGKSISKSTKAEFKVIENRGFGFDILPLDISEGVISYKSIKNGQLKKATWTGADGVTINLNPPKGTQGDYTLDGPIIIGRNNFYGEQKFTDIYIDGGDAH